VKPTDRNNFKKKEVWELSELKLVDAKNASGVSNNDIKHFNLKSFLFKGSPGL